MYYIYHNGRGFHTGYYLYVTGDDGKEVERIKEEYNTLIENYGAVIRSVTRIVRTELESPSILQNADFSLKTIKELIVQGERKTHEELAYCKNIQYQF